MHVEGTLLTKITTHFNKACPLPAQNIFPAPERITTRQSLSVAMVSKASLNSLYYGTKGLFPSNETLPPASPNKRLVQRVSFLWSVKLHFDYVFRLSIDCQSVVLWIMNIPP